VGGSPLSFPLNLGNALNTSELDIGYRFSKPAGPIAVVTNLCCFRQYIIETSHRAIHRSNRLIR
jgi:hypothetical protein